MINKIAITLIPQFLSYSQTMGLNDSVYISLASIEPRVGYTLLCLIYTCTCKWQ